MMDWKKIEELKLKAFSELFIKMVDGGAIIHRGLFILALKIKEQTEFIEKINAIEKPSLCSICNRDSFGCFLVHEADSMLKFQYFCVGCSGSHVQSEWQAQEIIYQAITKIEELAEHIKSKNNFATGCLIHPMASKCEA